MDFNAGEVVLLLVLAIGSGGNYAQAAARALSFFS